MSPVPAIIIFTRYPVPGQTKTRLIPVLGAEQAARFQKNLTQRIIKKTHAAVRESPAQLIISYAHTNLRKMQQWLGKEQTYFKQNGHNLGQKLSHSFAHAFKHDFDPVIIIGSDIPGLNSNILKTALYYAQNYPVVLGPAKDGGYYLISLQRVAFSPLLFRHINWGTGSVLKETITRIDKLAQSYYLLPSLVDIDTPENIENFKKENPELFQKLGEA